MLKGDKNAPRKKPREFNVFSVLSNFAMRQKAPKGAGIAGETANNCGIESGLFVLPTNDYWGKIGLWQIYGKRPIHLIKTSPVGECE